MVRLLQARDVRIQALDELGDLQDNKNTTTTTTTTATTTTTTNNNNKYY